MWTAAFTVVRSERQRRQRPAMRISPLGGNPAGKHNQQQIVRPTTAAGTSLDRLVRDIKGKVEIAKDFWKDLPHSICNSEAAELNNSHNCWNGQNKAKYVMQFLFKTVCGSESLLSVVFGLVSSGRWKLLEKNEGFSWSPTMNAEPDTGCVLRMAS